MSTHSTIDPTEVAKFAHHATAWWDQHGPLKTLHDINPPRLDFIQQFTKLTDLRVLDVGCGGGILSEGMASQGAYVTGLDIEPNALNTAREHAIYSGLSIDYIYAPIESYSAEPFDVITCMEMLEHVKEPSIVIRHCARLLKPGGYLFLSTINRTLAAYTTAVVAAEYILRLLPRQTHDFDKFIKPAELARMARNVGLDTIGLKGMHYNPFTRLATLDDSVTVNYLLACSLSSDFL